MTTPLMPRLRALLDRAEPFALVYASTPDGARSFIQMLDEIDALVADCDAAGLQIEPERVRVVALDGRAFAHAEAIIAALGSTPLPDHSHYGPRLRALATARRTQRWRRRGIIAGIVALVILALTLVVVTAPPSADTLSIMNTAIAGDTRGAYTLALHEHEAFPNDAEVTLWLSVLAEVNNDPNAAAAYWDQTRALSQQKTALTYQRGNTRLLVKNYAAAMQSVTDLLAAPATVPEGLFLRAGVKESQGDVSGAIADYEAASAAADSANRQELVALSRIRMGGLLQFGARRTVTPTTK